MFFWSLIAFDPDAVAANPNKQKRWSRKHLFRVAVEVMGNHKWMVHFDDGTQCECISNTLVVAPVSSSLPPEGFRPQLPHFLAAWAATREGEAEQRQGSGSGGGRRYAPWRPQ